MFGFFGFVVLIVAVIVGIRRYRRYHTGPLTATEGAKLGAATGFVAFPSAAILVGAIAAFSPQVIRDAMLQSINERVAQHPEFREFAAMVSTPQGLVGVTIMLMIMLLVFFVVVATVTGTLTASISRNSAR